MLSLGLIAAVSMPAAATDVKIGGSYFVAGYYESNHSLLEDAPSMAYYGQRIRLEPVFQVAEGLSFNLRVDAMERVWGLNSVGSEANNPNTSFSYSTSAMSARNKAAEQNVQFRRGWMTFLTGIGQFRIGYMADGTWGTDFGDLSSEGAEIVYATKIGPVVLVAVTEKVIEGRFTNYGGFNAVDSDVDKYCITPLYFWDKGQAGYIYCYVRVAAQRPLPLVAGGQNILYYHMQNVYLKGTFGPVYVEGEVSYQFGKAAEFDDNVAGVADVDYKAMEWYLMAKVNLGPAYIGAQYGFASGDDPGTNDEVEMILAPGNVWQPTLVLFNDWTNRWAGDMGTFATTGNSFANASLYQVFAGYNPTPKLGIKASVSMAYADEKPAATFVDDEYGTEFDLTVSYKIYDNLEYMVGFGYLWAGDYYKGVGAANKIDDDYLLMHQLTLTF